MPLTPFHFGPGLLIKSILLRRFSFFVFICSQILIDCETASNILAGREKLHTFFHTYLGSLVIVIFLTFIARPLFRLTMRIWAPSSKDVQLPLSLASVSALIGVWSHISLDSIMHQDITPFNPFSDANPFLGIISLNALHLGCLYSGILGGIIWMIRVRLNNVWSPGRPKMGPDL